MIFFKTVVLISMLSIMIPSQDLHGQSTFGSYMNKLFFNVYSKSPDPSIIKFLQNFVPSLLNPREQSGNWIAYPTTTNSESLVTISHSLFFYSHPFIKDKFVSGEFKIYIDTTYDSTNFNSETAGIKNIQMVLEFSKLPDAINVFTQLNENFVSVGQQSSFLKDSTTMYAEIYSRELMYDIPGRVKLHLFLEPAISGLYQLTISSN